MIDQYQLTVHDLTVEIRRKPIKNLHIRVYPPDAQVRVSVPRRMSRKAVQAAVISRLDWILRKRRHVLAQPHESAREMVTGEQHWFRGRRVRLEVRETTGRTGVLLQDGRRMILHARRNADTAARRRVLERWYRGQMQALLPGLIEKWEPRIGERVAECRIKHMKTRWGSCNIPARRIWLNLDLIRRPPECLEYVFVHEMVHLLERNHTARFRAFMGQFLPDWQCRRDMLNGMPPVDASP